MVEDAQKLQIEDQHCIESQWHKHLLQCSLAQFVHSPAFGTTRHVVRHVANSGLYAKAT